MDPLTQFCHNPDCPARGQPGFGNIRVHSRAERRYRCTTCGRTFAVTRDNKIFLGQNQVSMADLGPKVADQRRNAVGLDAEKLTGPGRKAPGRSF